MDARFPSPLQCTYSYIQTIPTDRCLAFLSLHRLDTGCIEESFVVAFQ